MTCKDCLYFKRCVVLGVELDINRNKEADKNCRHFTNKANYVEAKYGEWILRRQSNGVKTHQCSVCGRLIYTIDEDLEDYAPYCHCGAKMSSDYESIKNESD